VPFSGKTHTALAPLPAPNASPERFRDDAFRRFTDVLTITIASNDPTNSVKNSYAGSASPTATGAKSVVEHHINGVGEFTQVGSIAPDVEDIVI
jgi:hypothetical protein